MQTQFAILPEQGIFGEVQNKLCRESPTETTRKQSWGRQNMPAQQSYFSTRRQRMSRQLRFSTIVPSSSTTIPLKARNMVLSVVASIL